MRYRTMGAAACALGILLSVAAPLFENRAEPRVHQHLTAVPRDEATRRTDVFCTHLPLVEIDTGGIEIPGKAVLGDNGLPLYYTTTENGETRIRAHMEIVDNETAYNCAGDAPAVSTDIEINVRGRSSRAFDKSSYFIRMQTEDGDNNPNPVMGMDAHHEWVLYGPYLDKSLLRNYMLYNIGGELMDYAPNVRFCEVLLNGEYDGVYVMLENITAGKDGARLSLSVSKKNNTFSGYLLRLDELESSSPKDIYQFSEYARRTVQDMEIIYPGTANLTPEISDGICRDFSDFEKALYSYDYDNVQYGYDSMIDTMSFIDYFLINEITCNYDAGWLSTYIYKDISGKYKMCIWDMNNSCDYYRESQTDPMRFDMQNALWFFMLMKDEDFTDALIDRYWVLRETYFDYEYLDQYIDGAIAYLGDAVDRNYERWGYSFGEEHDMFVPKERNPRSYEESVEQLKDFFRRRLTWLDENIETLRQYSAESKVKKQNENAN